MKKALRKKKQRDFRLQSSLAKEIEATLGLTYRDHKPR